MLKIIKYNKSIQKRLNKDNIFEKIKTEKKPHPKTNYKLENIISLTTNKNNTLYLIDKNKDKNLENKNKTHCFIYEFNYNDTKTFDYIKKYYYEKIKLPNTYNLVYLIEVNNNLKNLKRENIIYNDNIKIFANSNKMNLISFNKNFGV